MTEGGDSQRVEDPTMSLGESDNSSILPSDHHHPSPHPSPVHTHHLARSPNPTLPPSPASSPSHTPHPVYSLTSPPSPVFLTSRTPHHVHSPTLSRSPPSSPSHTLHSAALSHSSNAGNLQDNLSTSCDFVRARHHHCEHSLNSDMGNSLNLDSASCLHRRFQASSPSPTHSLPPSPPMSPPSLKRASSTQDNSPSPSSSRTSSPPPSPSRTPHLNPSPATALVISPTPDLHQNISLTSCHAYTDNQPASDLASSGPHKSSLSTSVFTSNSHTCPINFPGASPRLLQLLEGITEPGDSGNSTEPPDWLDRKLFDRGREFYHRYLFCLSFSDLLSLVMMMSIKHGLQPLIYTGRSDTPYKALRRYMSTFLHLITWYKGDVWDPEDPAHKDIMSVRKTHARVASNINNKDYENVRAMSVRDKGHEEPSDPLHPSISLDFSAAADSTLPELDITMTFLNQFDMSVTQYTFMGLILAHPEKLGAASATEEDFEGLLHFWRGLGWLLGIEDKYNFCVGSVKEVRALCIEFEQRFGIPGLATAGWDYEHMASVLINGIGYVLHTISYPSMLCYLAYTIDVPIPNVMKRITFQHLIRYWMMRLLFGFIHLVPQSLGRLNHGVTSLMDTVRDSRRLNISAYRNGQTDDSVTESRCPFR